MNVAQQPLCSQRYQERSGDPLSLAQQRSAGTQDSRVANPAWFGHLGSEIEPLPLPVIAGRRHGDLPPPKAALEALGHLLV